MLSRIRTRAITQALVAGLLVAFVSVTVVALDEVTVQLKWLHQAQFAGFYVAEAQGYYEDEGIDVTFAPGGIGIDIFGGVLDESIQFAVVGADAALQSRSEGNPVVAIATTYRINPVVFVAFAESGITSPYEFPGRSVTIGPGYDMAILNAMLSNIGVEVSAIEIVPYTYDDQPFIDGEVDVSISFAAGSLPALRAELGSQKLNVIWPDDYGVHFYSDTIIVNETLLGSDPDLVLRFLRATLRGHRYAISNPEDAIDASMVYAVVQNRDVQADMLEASIPLIYTGKDQIGWMQPTIWRGMYDILLGHDDLAEPFDETEMYTMQFLEAIYVDE